jgi:flagellar basal-body rod protein FlgB
MNLAEIPVFAMLRNRLGYLSERQKVLAQNVANADTPNYISKDLKPFSFEAHVRSQGGQTTRASQSSIGGIQSISTTQVGHMPLTGATTHQRTGGSYKPLNTPGPEVTLNGNSVVLEEEMVKMTDARMNYDAAIGFYQKSLNLLRLATRAPGRG